ncbi:MAG: M20 family peptidase, partial [Dehalococcoidales bacterium]|nr:M20 family peptidase [Dehalococcoidales bacterium]
MDIDKLKAAVIREIDARYRELGELSKKLHDNPEIAFEEKQASAWLAEFLEQNDFTVDRGICELPTAFRGRYGTGQPV